MLLRYSFNGVDCPNCAAKIERRISEHRQVENARMDFTQCSLTLKTRDGINTEALERDIRAIFFETDGGASIHRADMPEPDSGVRRFILLR